jgi:hypothetical protein
MASGTATRLEAPSRSEAAAGGVQGRALAALAPRIPVFDDFASSVSFDPLGSLERLRWMLRTAGLRRPVHLANSPGVNPPPDSPRRGHIALLASRSRRTGSGRRHRSATPPRLGPSPSAGSTPAGHARPLACSSAKL